MNALKMSLYVVGGILVVGGLMLAYFEAGLDQVFSPGLALAGFLVLVGLLVLGLSARAGEPETAVVSQHHYHADEHGPATERIGEAPERDERDEPQYQHTEETRTFYPAEEGRERREHREETIRR